MHGILVPRNGGADVLEYAEIDVPPPGPGEVQIRRSAIGLNYIDTCFRRGLYPAGRRSFPMSATARNWMTAPTRFFQLCKAAKWLSISIKHIRWRTPRERTPIWKTEERVERLY
ncbi:MAG: zinc-binding dehydrogenase family protein [Rhizobium sp.]|nr:zinc-binding dehydrogenase family protein [Rhizobium sp.]